MVVLGVTDEGTPVGVLNPEKMVKELFDLGRNRSKISAEVWSEKDVSIEQVGEYNLIVIRVVATPRTKRPVYINGNPITGTYLRRHTGDYKCNEDEVRRMFRESSSESIDSTVLLDLGPESLNQDTIIRYRQRLQNRYPEHEFNDYSQDRFLNALGAIDNSCRHPTVAGLLFLGNNESLRKWRKRHLIDYRLNSAKISESIWKDRLAWDGNLFDGYFKIFPRVTEDIQISHRIESGERVEDTPAHTALREALVNMLVHADYTETEASLLVKSPEGYLFRNPGNSRVPSHDLFVGNRSDPRNPTLLFMFRLVGLAEEAGSGLPKIIRAWRSLGLQVPNVEVGTERYEFALLLRQAHLFSEDDRVWLTSLSNELTEPEQLALVCVKHQNRIDNERLRTLLPMHPADATRVLTSLRDKGLLKKESDRRGAFYHIPGTPVELDGNLELFEEEGLRDVDKHLSDARESLREENEILRGIKNGLRGVKSRAKRRQFITASILSLCSIRAFGNKELASVFRMTPTNLVTAYLSQMVEEGQLEWTGRNKSDKRGKYRVPLKESERKESST